MTSKPPNFRSEIEQLETELNAVVELSSVSQTQRDALRERLRLLKEKAGHNLASKG